MYAILLRLGGLYSLTHCIVNFPLGVGINNISPEWLHYKPLDIPICSLITLPSYEPNWGLYFTYAYNREHTNAYLKKSGNVDRQQW